MGRLNVPPTADPASGGRKAPAGPGSVGNETDPAIETALASQPGPGAKRNVGGPGLGHNSAELHKALP
mgnify:FL=1